MGAPSPSGLGEPRPIQAQVQPRCTLAGCGRLGSDTDCSREAGASPRVKKAVVCTAASGSGAGVVGPGRRRPSSPFPRPQPPTPRPSTPPPGRHPQYFYSGFLDVNFSLQSVNSIKYARVFQYSASFMKSARRLATKGMDSGTPSGCVLPAAGADPVQVVPEARGSRAHLSYPSHAHKRPIVNFVVKMGALPS